MIPWGEPSAFSLHCRWCTPALLPSKAAGLWKSTYSQSTYSVHRSREAGGKKVKAWVREINEEFIYRVQGATPAEQGEAGQDHSSLWVGHRHREHRQHLPCDRHGHGSSSTRTAEELTVYTMYRMGHQTETLHEQKHVRDSTVLRLVPFNHSQSTHSLLLSHQLLSGLGSITKKCTAVIKLSSLQCWHAANTFK